MRPWVEKIESGEYLYEWRGYSPFWVCGMYCDNLNINEDKYINCTGAHYGIGDVEWWITAELDKLSEDEKDELEKICRYKRFINNEAKPKELINKLTEFFECEFYHIHRTGNEEILKFCRMAHNYREEIKKHSKGSRDETTKKLYDTDSPFFIPTFEEYNEIMLKKEFEENKVGYILGFESYLDGGTVEIKTIDGDFFIDYRIKTLTYGMFYDKYPGDGVEPIEVDDETINKIINGLKEYHSPIYETTINNVINELENI